jgi:sec-independent protein translocase protein TatA
MPNLGGGELIALALVLVVLFGWKKLPDMARSLGRSARVFKSEVSEMKQDGKPGTEESQASQTTVHGDVVNPVQTPAPTPAPNPAQSEQSDQTPRGDRPAL